MHTKATINEKKEVEVLTPTELQLLRLLVLNHLKEVLRLDRIECGHKCC